MTTQNKTNGQTVRDFFQAIENKDAQNAYSILGENTETLMLAMPDEPMRGESVKKMFESWNNAFSNLKFDIINLVETDDCVVVEYLCKGTNDGPMVSEKGTMPATHHEMSVPSCDLFRFENGKISSWRSYWQNEVAQRQLYQQLVEQPKQSSAA